MAQHRIANLKKELSQLSINNSLPSTSRKPLHWNLPHLNYRITHMTRDIENSMWELESCEMRRLAIKGGFDIGNPCTTCKTRGYLLMFQISDYVKNKRCPQCKGLGHLTTDPLDAIKVLEIRNAHRKIDLAIEDALIQDLPAAQPSEPLPSTPSTSVAPSNPGTSAYCKHHRHTQTSGRKN